MTLKLSRLPSGAPEIFASIQGEGVSVGLPSCFVRLARCNLRCEWCDTPYTWDWSRYDPKQEIVRLEPEAVAERVLAAGVRNVVLTGGEPLLQQRDLVTLTSRLRAAGCRIEVETNGTLCPEPALAAQVDQWNVSPKLAHSGNPAPQRHRPAVLAWFASQPTAHFKFVVWEPADLAEIDALLAPLAVSPERVVLMPEGRTPQAINARSRWLVEACLQRGNRFSTRLHILLWGDERGR